VPERIVVVDDQEFVREGLCETLSRAGYGVEACESGEEALHALSEGDAAALVTDLRMPGMSGMELLERARRMDQTLPVIMITAFATVENAVEAMKKGAYDYIMKPFNADAIEVTVAKALRHRRLLAENDYLRGELNRQWSAGAFVGEAAPMAAVYEQIERIAPADSTVLVRGETGTGKELAAGAIHAMSPRAERPLVRVNCAALSAGLLESELFGHEKGAFTGADRKRVGRFELAEGGTILLDEISEMDLGLQGKLLRVLQEKQYERVGSSQTQETDARVIATSNRDLEHAIEEGTFRRDLFYRLNVVPLTLPPLRERKEDIPLLVKHFLEKHAPRTGRSVRDVSPEAIELLRSYHWPGNVRELENIVERALVLGRGELLEAGEIALGLGSAPQTPAAPDTGEPATLADVEREHVYRVLERFDGHRQKTADALGISERSLRDRLKRWKEGE
jgi:DNA-binding NtrC family response regulator